MLVMKWLDTIGLMDLLRMDKRQFFYQLFSFGMIVTSALMMWKGLMLLTGTGSPIVVVLSGSMEPAFQRGDLLFLKRAEDVRIGAVVVFQVQGRDVPIVHRVVQVHVRSNGTAKFLTKGDNNAVDDRGLYPSGQKWLPMEDIVGQAVGILPHVGFVTIMMNEWPQLKYGVLALLALYLILHRE